MIESIRQCALLRDFSDAELAAIEKAGACEDFPAAGVILKNGGTGKALNVVLSGKVSVNRKTNAGERTRREEYLPGDFFGEEFLTGNHPVSDAYIAAEHVRLLVFSEAGIRGLIENDSDIAVKFISRLLSLTVQRLRSSSRFYSDIVQWGENASRRVITDELTGIYNRAFLEDALENFFNISRSNRKPLALFMIDLDNFRTINETYGLETGNHILLVLVSVIKNLVSSHGIIARFGGDEFVVLLPEADLAKACDIAATIRAEVEAHDFSKYTGGTRVPVTTSIGVSSYPECCDDLVAFKEKADAALYRAKSAGRNRVECAE